MPESALFVSARVIAQVEVKSQQNSPAKGDLTCKGKYSG